MARFEHESASHLLSFSLFSCCLPPLPTPLPEIGFLFIMLFCHCVLCLLPPPPVVAMFKWLWKCFSRYLKIAVLSGSFVIFDILHLGTSCPHTYACMWSLLTSKVSRQALPYPSFRSSKILDGMQVHLRVTPQIKFAATWMERRTGGVKCLAHSPKNTTQHKSSAL